jgi:hypothetical protein
MAMYRDRLNYKPYNINDCIITIDKKYPIIGLNLFEAERDDDEIGESKVASGHGQFVEIPSESGIITIEFLAASPSSDILWDLFEEKRSFAISAKNSKAEKFSVAGSYCRIVKAPKVMMGGEPEPESWQFKAMYLDIRGGSYALATV